VKARTETVYARDGYHTNEVLSRWGKDKEAREREKEGKKGNVRMMSLKRYVEEALEEDEVARAEGEKWLRVRPPLGRSVEPWLTDSSAGPRQNTVTLRLETLEAASPCFSHDRFQSVVYCRRYGYS